MSTGGWNMTETEYLRAPGASLLAFHNVYPQGKQGGIELIHHGRRVAACGMVRPDPWRGRPSAFSKLLERRAQDDPTRLEVDVHEPNLELDYRLTLRPDGASVALTVESDQPLPDGAPAAFCLELFPPAHFGRGYSLDGVGGVFPREPDRPVRREADGTVRATTLAAGRRLVLCPEDDLRRVEIEAAEGSLELLDARKRDIEVWFAVVSPLPAGQTGRVLQWRITPNRVAGWRRQPVLCVSQVGYHPDQQKQALIELDPRWDRPEEASLLRVLPEGGLETALSAPLERWGSFLRYDYAVFDFTDQHTEGLYYVEYAGERAGPFRIADDIYEEGVWQPTLEAFLPVQMCHVAVWEERRLWHGACHLDDAIQAPTSHEHHDHYHQGPQTQTPYEPFERIPHLNRGGWHDAGDTDLAAGSQAATTHMLALAREEFGVDTDQTTVREDDHEVLMYVPDGQPDILQQVAWGAQCLLGGYRAVGHSLVGIVHGDPRGFYQTGEVAVMTDNLAYDSALAPGERAGERSGRRDDRWAFTGLYPSLEFQVAAALAAAARVLRGYDHELSAECLEAALQGWRNGEENDEPERRNSYVPGNPAARQVTAAAELLLTTGEDRFRARLRDSMDVVRDNMWRVGGAVARAARKAEDAELESAFRTVAEPWRDEMHRELRANPFGVLFRHHVWGATWRLLAFAADYYYLVRLFPDLFERGPVLRAVEYALGCHPASNVSLVSGVGTHSLTTAFGINRGSWSYIPGGVVSGPNVIRPDFPELKEGFPFLWQQSEYVIGGAAGYIFCVLAARDLLERPKL
ncbi:MAG: glycoside hydrolase family 9 protein [Candidatus Brocadiia bacterium]